MTEIISPGNRHKDKMQKIKIYREALFDILARHKAFT